MLVSFGVVWLAFAEGATSGLSSDMIDDGIETPAAVPQKHRFFVLMLATRLAHKYVDRKLCWTTNTSKHYDTTQQSEHKGTIVQSSTQT